MDANVANQAFQIGGGVAESPTMGGFTPTLWVGPVTAMYIYQVGWLSTDLAQLAKDKVAGLGGGALDQIDPSSETESTFGDILGDNPFDGFRKGQASGKFVYFYRDAEHAATVCRMFDLVEPAMRKDGSSFKHRPQQVWRLETSVAECLTLNAEAKAKFESDGMTWDIDVKAMGSGSPKQHLVHLLALPSAVKAYADLAGWPTPPMQAIDELSGPSDEVIITEVLYDRLVGGSKDAPMEESQAWKDRTALWAALGEPDPAAFGWTAECWKAITGSEEGLPDDGRAKLTDSLQLGNALRVLRSSWDGPTYAAVLQVPDPNPANAYESNGQVRNPKVAIFKAFYPDRATAVAAVAEMDIEVDAGSADNIDTAGLAIPEVYQGDAELWLGQVASQVAKHLVGVANLPQALKEAKVKTFVESEVGQQVLAGELLATADEFTAAVMVL